MIATVKAFTSGDGSLHPTLAAAQAADLEALFKDMETSMCQAAAIAKRVLENRDRILDVLTTSKRSRPGRRLVNGYKSKRKAAAGQEGAAAATTAA